MSIDVKSVPHRFENRFVAPTSSEPTGMGASEPMPLDLYSNQGSETDIEQPKPSNALPISKAFGDRKCPDNKSICRIKAPPYLPAEMVMQILGEAEINPVGLMGLMLIADTKDARHSLKSFAYDNTSWAPFTPHREVATENLKPGAHAEAFKIRYQAMSPEHRTLFHDWWSKPASIEGIDERAPDPSIFKNFDLVLAAVSQDGNMLRYADLSLKCDPVIVRAAVSQDGLALWEADESLKGDREIVLAAVKQNGLALRFAHESLQRDPDIVRAAVSQNGLLLFHVHESLKGDREIVLAAVKQNSTALKFAHESLKRDPEFTALAGEL